MASISSSSYDCPTQTLTVTIAGTGEYRVSAVVVPDSATLPSGEFPPANAQTKQGSGAGDVPLTDPTWPSTGKVKWRVWLVVPGGTQDGNKDCGGASSSSSMT